MSMHSRNPRWIAENLVKQIVKRLREIPEVEMAYLILRKYRPEALSSLREDVATILTGALRDALGPNATPFHRVEELLALARRAQLNAGDMRDEAGCDAAAVEVGVLEDVLRQMKHGVAPASILDVYATAAKESGNDTALRVVQRAFAPPAKPTTA